MTQTHKHDLECSVDPETDKCRDCGAHHGEPCPECGGKAFHRPTCPTCPFGNGWAVKRAETGETEALHWLLDQAAVPKKDAAGQPYCKTLTLSQRVEVLIAQRDRVTQALELLRTAHGNLVIEATRLRRGPNKPPESPV